MSSDPGGGGPFRDGGGTPCPRCGLPMSAADPTEPMYCADICGAWYSPTALNELIDPPDLTGHTINGWKHGTVRACPVCQNKMAIIGKDTNTVECCSAHGLWVEDSRRDKFFVAFNRAIEAQRQRKAAADNVARMSPRQLTDLVSDLVQRVHTLEQAIVNLTEQLRDVRSRTSSF